MALGESPKGQPGRNTETLAADLFTKGRSGRVCDAIAFADRRRALFDDHAIFAHAAVVGCARTDRPAHACADGSTDRTANHRTHTSANSRTRRRSGSRILRMSEARQDPERRGGG